MKKELFDELLQSVREGGEILRGEREPSKGPEAEGPLGRLPGLLQHYAKERPVTVEEMKKAVGRRVARG